MGRGKGEQQRQQGQHQGVGNDLPAGVGGKKADEVLQAHPIASPEAAAGLVIAEGDLQAVHGQKFEQHKVRHHRDQDQVQIPVFPERALYGGTARFLHTLSLLSAGRCGEEKGRAAAEPKRVPFNHFIRVPCVQRRWRSRSASCQRPYPWCAARKRPIPRRSVRVRR